MFSQDTKQLKWSLSTWQRTQSLQLPTRLIVGYDEEEEKDFELEEEDDFDDEEFGDEDGFGDEEDASKLATDTDDEESEDELEDDADEEGPELMSNDKLEGTGKKEKSDGDGG
ncbi:MAG: hypothetical protein O2875_02675, partial [Planctomycetota bacterium]|nr:hypothetical protein [Planctomycetota bacterium]